MSTAPRLAIFDLDGTILRVESGMSWMKFQYRSGKVSRGDLAKAFYWSLLYKAAILDMESLAQRLVEPERGRSVAELQRETDEWIDGFLLADVTVGARRALAFHKGRGDHVIMATGSTQFAAGGIAQRLGIDDVIATELDVADGALTGRLRGYGFGRHKLAALEKFAGSRGASLARATFYTDSYHDIDVMARVGTPVAINPDVRLYRHARRHGWTIENWL